jgi:hypothetical protein
MRKIILFIAALLFMAVPVMAVSIVHINCSDDDVNQVTVSYVSDHNLIRAFGLNITVDTNKIKSVNSLDPNYRIYPGQIVISADGKVTDYNTPYDPCDIGDANLAIEMGSLYTTDANYASDANLGYNKKPGLSGTLLKFKVGGDCNYFVDVNALRGGVVMEDPYEDPCVIVCNGHIGPPEGCPVPNEVNVVFATAKTAITNANLLIGSCTTAASSTIAAGKVISTNPAFGQTPACGSGVDIVVSYGAATCATCLGDLNGDSWKKLSDMYALRGRLVTAYARTGSLLVDRSDPNLADLWVACGDINGDGFLTLADLYMLRGQLVTGNTNTGSLQAPFVPNCVNKTQAAATTLITNAALVVGTVTQANNPTIPAGNVISTNPPFLTPAACGTDVNMVVSLGP